MRQCWRWQKPVEQVHFPGPEPTLPVRVHKWPEFQLRGSVPHQLHGLVQFDGNVLPGGWSFESMNRRALRRAQRADALLREPGYRFLASTAGPGQSPDQNRPLPVGHRARLLPEFPDGVRSAHQAPRSGSPLAVSEPALDERHPHLVRKHVPKRRRSALWIALQPDGEDSCRSWDLPGDGASRIRPAVDSLRTNTPDKPYVR